MSDDYPDSATREFCGNFILCVAVAILIIVEILLPDIAQLEDPVFAGSRCKLNYERSVLRTGPAPEAMIPVSDPAIGQINLIVKDYPVLGCRQSFLPPMADHMGIGQDCLSGAGQIEADITQADWSGVARCRRPAGCRIVVERFLHGNDRHFEPAGRRSRLRSATSYALRPGHCG